MRHPVMPVQLVAENWHLASDYHHEIESYDDSSLINNTASLSDVVYTIEVNEEYTNDH